MKKELFFLAAMACVLFSDAQKTYSLDASHASVEIKNGLLKMGNPGPSGKEILVNNRYMTVGGKPMLPVMGELHFTRIPRSQWEDVILKMKACGVNIISFYLFWNHHEEIEGQFDWSGDKDLRAFVQLCAKHGLWAYPRLGPWAHGEARNGGTPDWLLQKEYFYDRTNDPVYQRYAEEWYRQIAMQLNGLLYKDGGPVIGVQIENEYARGKSGEAHIAWLKKITLKYGLDVPIYSVTGWGDGSVPPLEVIPFWGTYPDAPWNTNLDKIADCSEYHFVPFRHNEKFNIATTGGRKAYMGYEDYPYFTCEMGVGIENSNHRRLQIGGRDGLSLMVSKIGSGTNLLGYYMFAGGSNPHGQLTSMEENDETGYGNTSPAVSYDFQAAIRESGELNDSYFEIKKLNYFLNEYGSLLAQMEPVFPASQEELAYTVRVKDNAAFLFGMNYCRNTVTSEKKNIQFSVKLKSETLSFPSKPINITDSSLFIWPINFSMQQVLLKYATAQPLCHLGNKWVFIQDLSISPEFCFDASTTGKPESTTGKVIMENGRYIVSDLKPGMNCVITLHGKDGQDQQIILLSKTESRQAWLFHSKNEKYFFVSASNLYMNNGTLHAYGLSEHMKISMLNPGPGVRDIFRDYSYAFTEKTQNLDYKELRPLDGARWLKISAVDSLSSNNKLMHRFFVKEFSLGNPSRIKKASLIIAPQADCRLQLNNVWGNQHIIPNAMNVIDITGYVQKGMNNLMLDFPFESGQKGFAARVVVEYFNNDEVDWATDNSWITKDDYGYPSFLIKGGGYRAPDSAKPANALNEPLKDFNAYAVEIPAGYSDGLNNVYLKISYTGDKARLYTGYRLAGNDFNNGRPWSTGLNRLCDDSRSLSLRLEIQPLPQDARIYFDDDMAKQAALKATVKSIQLLPEYSVDLEVTDSGLEDRRAAGPGKNQVKSISQVVIH